MDLNRDEHGVWTIEASPEEQARRPDYIEALARYLTGIDELFAVAQDRREFEFVHSLLAIRGVQGAGWDAFATTDRAITTLVEVHNELADDSAARHLKLWIYGHIVEASEPYELLANLLDVARGGRFNTSRFPDLPNGRPQSPGAKLDTIEVAARKAGFPRVSVPLRERWDRGLRNAIFHADYAFGRGGVNLVSAQETRRFADVERICARANASHDALVLLGTMYLGSYDKPTTIPAHGYSPDPTEQAVVIVRAGHGAIGLKDAHTKQEIAAGAIPWRMTLAYPDEVALLDADPELALLPSRPAAPRS